MCCKVEILLFSLKSMEDRITWGTTLVYGIYPEWAIFVKTIPLPQNDKDKLFATHQTGARKYVERTFGVLQDRFAILRAPACFWQRSTISKTIYVCIIIIMNNMIVENERDSYRMQIDFFAQFDQGERKGYVY